MALLLFLTQLFAKQGYDIVINFTRLRDFALFGWDKMSLSILWCHFNLKVYTFLFRVLEPHNFQVMFPTFSVSFIIIILSDTALNETMETTYIRTAL